MNRPQILDACGHIISFFCSTGTKIEKRTFLPKLFFLAVSFVQFSTIRFSPTFFSGYNTNTIFIDPQYIFFPVHSCFPQLSNPF